MTNKIILFDSWTAGSIHLKYLNYEFKNSGWELLLLHVGSWGHEKDFTYEKEVNGIICRDIKFYKGLGLYEIFELEKPRAVLFLSTRAFAHMAFNCIARYKKVPTFHLYHGLVTVQGIDSDGLVYKISPYLHLKKIINALSKNIFFIFPSYLLALIITKGKLKEYRAFLIEIFLKIKGEALPDRFIVNTETNFGVVYLSSDARHMELNYKVQKENIYVSGNPDLLKFNFIDSHLLGYIDIKTNLNQCMYIETGLVPSGFVFKNYNDYYEYLMNVRFHLEKMDVQMIFKPHPATSSLFLDRLSIGGIKVTSNEEFRDNLYNSKFVLVEPSTLSILPTYFGKPIGLMKFGKLKEQSFGIILESYPFKVDIVSSDNLLDLASLKNQSELELKEWQNSHLGLNLLYSTEMIKNFIIKKINKYEELS